MRPLRWVLPALALLLIAPLLPGAPNAPRAAEAYAETFILEPTSNCPPLALHDCLRDDWTFNVTAALPVTAIVVEVDFERDAPPVGLGLAGATVSIQQVPTEFEASLVQPWDGPPGQLRVEWESGPAGSDAGWAFEVDFSPHAVRAGYQFLDALDVRVGVTFAYGGFELPPEYRIFPFEGGSESQTLLDNLDLSTDILPCASASSIPRSLAGLLVPPTKTC